MSPKIPLSDVVSALREGDSFIIVSHYGPDGDALGSTLAMSELIEGMGKKNVTCVNADAVPENYRWLPFADMIMPPESVDEKPDTIVYLDCSHPDRIGNAKNALPNKAKTIVIDHHLEEDPCGDVNYVDSSYAATGEIIFDLFKEADVEITPEAATLLYVAITTDTGGFRYGNTTSRSHSIAAALVDLGVDVAEISERVFDRTSLGKFNLIARVLGNARMSADGRVAGLMVHDADIRDAGATLQDVEGIINYARNVDTVQVACIFKETGPTTTKISIRARAPFNAADFCKRYGGGGHAGAAGAAISGPIDEVIEPTLIAIEEMLKEIS